MSIQTYPLATAIELSEKWDDQQNAYFATGNILTSITMSKQTAQAILALNENVTDIRIYLGITSFNEIKPFAVGVDADDNDIIPTVGDNKFVYNFLRPCPPFGKKKNFHSQFEDAEM